MTTRNRITLRKLLASLAIAVLAVPLVAPQFALAAYSASDVLGQVDAYENPVFDSGTANRYAVNAWPTILSTGGDIEDIARDTTNDVVYLAYRHFFSSTDFVLRCESTTGCNEESDFTTAYSAGPDANLSLEFDATNNILYMQSQSGLAAILYRCDVTLTNCDDTGDWTTVLAPAGSSSTSNVFSVPSLNAIYFGIYDIGSDTGTFYRCDMASGCATAGDWTTAALVTPGEASATVAADPVHGFLYASTDDTSSGAPRTYRCDMLTLCDATGDWTISYQVGTNSSNLFFEPDHAILYSADFGSNDLILRCDTNVSGSCDDAGDWSASLTLGPSVSAIMFGMEYSSPQGALYASFFDDINTIARIYRCDTTTDCDQTSDWVVAREFNSVAITAILADSDNDRIYAGDNQGAVYQCVNGECLSLTTAVSGQGMNGPKDAVVDTVHHRLFVADTGNNRVLVFDLDGDNNLIDHAADNVLGQSDFTTNAAQLTQNGLDTPIGLAYDSVGNRLFVADQTNSRVVVFDVAAITNGEDAAFVLGQEDFISSGTATTQDTFSSVQYLAYDPSGNRLFVADYANDRVMVFDVAAITNGEPAVNVLGQPNFTTSGNNTTQDGLGLVFGLAYAADTTRLFVTDSNNRVMVFDVAAITNGEPAVNVLGTSDFTIPGPAGASQNNVSSPAGVAYDSVRQRIAVTDTDNHRIMLWDVASITNGEDAVAVLGQDDFTSSGSATTQQGLQSPAGVAFDEGNNRLYIADSNNNRVIIHNFVQITTDTLSSGIVDAAYSQTVQTEDVQGTPDFAVASGSLPPGLSLDGSTGQIFGTPTAAGTYSFTIRVEDDNGGYGVFVDQQEISVTILSSGGYLASDAIGQLDENDEPLFTSSGADNAPNARGFGSPQKMAIDTVGHRLFVADPNNARVMVFNLDSSNQVVNRVADAVLGQPNFKSNNGGTSASLMSQPESVAYDEGASRLFVADASNNRVLVFDLSGGITSGMAASNVIGQANFDDSGSATSATGMRVPYGLLYDPTGNRLFVADWQNARVLIFDLSGGITNGMAASFELGQTDGNANLDFFDDADFFPISASKMSEPQGVAYDPIGQRLFVSENAINRILVFDVATITNGEPAVNVLGQPNFTSGDINWPSPFSFLATQTGLSRPTGITYDTAGQRLFVADSQNNRVMVFDVLLITNGEPAVNVLGQPDFTSNDPATTPSGMWGSVDVFVDSTGQRLFVPEYGNHRITVFDVSIITNGEDAVDLLGQLDENDEPFYTANRQNNAPSAQGVNDAQNVALDAANHRLFVADVQNSRVLVFDLDEDNQLIDRSADAVLGQEDFKGQSADTTQSRFGDPQGLAYDASGNRLFVADMGNRRVMVFDVASITNGEDAVHLLGNTDYTNISLSGTTQGTFTSPRNLAYDQAGGRLFVSDQSDHRVLVFDVTSITNGEDATNVLGQDTFVTNGPNLAQDGLQEPAGMAYDSAHGRLFVADNDHARVMVFDVTTITDGEDAVHVLGQEDFTTADFSTTQDRLIEPYGVAYDSSNDRLFVSDGFNNNRVMVFDTTVIVDGEDALAVLGQLNFTSSAAAVTRYSLTGPAGEDYDPALNRLYVVDQGSNRLMIYDFVRITTLTLPDGVEGEAYDQDIATTNSQGAVSFELVSGALPPGLSVSSITGTPTTPGTYTFTIRAVDDTGSWGEFGDLQTYTMTIQGGGGGGGGGGGFLPGATPTPTPNPSVTPAPLAGYIILDDQAPVTKDRFVKVNFKHPFTDDQGVSMRVVNGDQLAANDRDVVAANTARQQETGAAPTPAVSPDSPEMMSGQVRPFTPQIDNWDLCAGAKECRPGQYRVFVQYYKAASAPPTVLAGVAGDETSYIYADDIGYTPPAAIPTFPPSGPVKTPSPTTTPNATPIPVPSPTPSVSATPAASPVGLPAAGPQPGPFNLQSLGLSPATVSAIGDAISVAAPVIVVLVVAPIAIALATALAAGNAIAFTMFTAQSLLMIFGLKRRPRVWGTVYDAKTKHPIAYAKVELRDQSNRVLETRYTDSEGRYGFLITPASLQQQSLQLIITPSAKNYAFPSALVTTDPDYIVYDHVYHGGQIAIRRDELVNYNIPMDPGMTPAKVGRPWSYGSNIVDGILNAAFWIGLVVLPFNAFSHPSLFTIGMLVLFLVANAVRLGVGFHKPYGIVRDDRARTAVPYSLVTLNDPTGRRIAFTVSDDRGRYILLAKPGSYLVTVHTPAQVQPQRQKTTAVTTKKGWVTGTVNV